MKKIYNTPIVEVKAFEMADVITLSGGGAEGNMMTAVDFGDLFIE